MPFFSASSAMEGQNCSHMEGTQMDTGMLDLASSAMEVMSCRVYVLVTHCIYIFFFRNVAVLRTGKKCPERENTRGVTIHALHR